MAIVLVIIGILLGLGASLIGPLTKRIKVAESREVVKQAKEAVLGYVIRNGVLPQTLGSAGARSLDAWGRDLFYFAANELVGSGVDVCNIFSTTVQVNECKNTDCSSYDTKSDVAFVIYSRGDDGDANCTGSSSPFYLRESGMPYVSPCSYNASNPSFYYDDIMEYVSLNEIVSRRCQYSAGSSTASLCSQGGDCTNNCTIRFQNTSSDNNIWVKGGSANCSRVRKDEQITMSSLNGGDTIYIYNNAACTTSIDSLRLANPLKNNATLQWSSVGNATCN